MATETRRRKARDRGRTPYRFTAEQLMRMRGHGIIGDEEDVELWDGILYKMTKGELHNTIVMLVADALRAVVDASTHHVREEKSNADGARSLPEPDVTVTRGRKAVRRAGPPPLERVALAVEVDHRTSRADRVVKYRRYAARRVPVYWVIAAARRVVTVHERPEGAGAAARYGRSEHYSGAAEIPIVVDGQEVGRVAAAAMFPEAEDEPPAAAGT